MNMRKWGWVFAVPAVILPGVYFGVNSHANRKGTVEPSKAEVAQKVLKLQMPFIANNGQTDEKVKFYAKTLGGTVFVTKEGEIVYALPNNSSDVETQCLASLMHSPNGIHDARCRIQDNRESCIMDYASWIVGCASEVHQIGSCCIVNHVSDTNPQSKPTSDSPNLKSKTAGIALKETIIGAKIGGIIGEQPAVTTVNYFKGSDNSKWKTNVPTYDMVNLGEVYKGIELRLKAYGNNMEKLFTVKPGADPEQIKVRLSGLKDCGVQNAECGIENPKPVLGSARGSEFPNPILQINKSGELVAETELGPVKFTKPVAYQEIDGKRVEVKCKYTIADCGMQNAEYKTKGVCT